MGSSAVRELSYWGIKPTPLSIFLNSSFRSCAKSLGVDPKITETDEYSISGDGEISRPAFDDLSNKYKLVAYSLSYLYLIIGLIFLVILSFRKLRRFADEVNQIPQNDE